MLKTIDLKNMNKVDYKLIVFRLIELNIQIIRRLESCCMKTNFHEIISYDAIFIFNEFKTINKRPELRTKVNIYTLHHKVRENRKYSEQVVSLEGLNFKSNIALH